MSELFCPHCGGKLGMYLVALVGGSEGAVANEAAPGKEMDAADEALTETVLEVVCGLWTGDMYGAQSPDLRIGRVAEGVNLVLYGSSGGDDKMYVTPRKVGQVVRKQLHLRTRRSSEHGRARVVVWDAERIEELQHEWGVTDVRVLEVAARLRQDGLVAPEYEGKAK